MTQPKKGKSVFQQAIDAVSNRDEKAAVEQALKRAEGLEDRAEQAEQKAVQSAQKLAEAQKQITALQADLTKARSELTTVRTNLTAAQNRAFESERKLRAVTAELQKHVSADQAEQIAEAAAAEERGKTMAEHTVISGDTLSHVALKYYGSAAETHWRLIYEANKEAIGPNPGRISPGMVLKIPVLPDELKK